MKNKIFKFKNKRNYIHGTDIFNFLINKKNYKFIDIKFIKPSKHGKLILIINLIKELMH